MAGPTMEELRGTIGTEVWFHGAEDSINSGIITGVQDEEHVCVVYNKGVCVGAKITLHIDDVYHTQYDLMGADYQKAQAMIKEYKDRIGDMEELVRFCYKHMEGRSIAGWTACQAARQRFMELTGTELDPESAKEEKEIEELLKDGSEG